MEVDGLSRVAVFRIDPVLFGEPQLRLVRRNKWNIYTSWNNIIHFV